MKRYQLTGFAAVLACALVLPFAAGHAQGFPNREIKVISGYAAGTGGDIMVRFFAEQIRPFIGDKAVIVENKPGALSSIGAEAVARARPDGHTLFITGAVPLTANKFLLKKIGYDPVTDFSMISTLLWQPVVLIVPPTSPAKTVAELTALLKAKQGKASYGGVSTSSIATAEIYKSLVGLDVLQVPYKQTSPALSDMQDGSLDFIFGDPLAVLPLHRSGKVRALAVTTPQRSSTAPELPTMVEAGVPGYEWTSWWAAAAPPGTPREIVNTLNGWFTDMLKKESVKTFLFTNGAEPFPGTPESAKQRQIADITRWQTLFKQLNIEPQ